MAKKGSFMNFHFGKHYMHAYSNTQAHTYIHMFTATKVLECVAGWDAILSVLTYMHTYIHTYVHMLGGLSL
jgi:hypothetical protein